MEELIKVTYEKDRITVSARDLHEFLGSNERLSKWFDRMIGYGFEEGVDYTPYQKVHPQNNQAIMDYQLTIGMAKELAMIQRNDKGKQARQYFIQCEEQLKQPKSMEDILIYQLQEMKRLREQTEQVKAVALETKSELQGMRDVISLSPSSWRKNTSTIITRIAQKLGGNEYIQTVRQESYNLLEERGHFRLKQRLSNRKKDMALNCIAKSKIDKLNKLDIIESDPRILECYLAIVKEMAIKYGVTVPDQLTAPSIEPSQQAAA